MHTAMKLIIVSMNGLLVMGCSQHIPETSPSRNASAAPTADAGTSTPYPLSLTNCGHDVVVQTAPQRVVALNQSAAEILIHLGATERLVGTGYEVDAIPDAIAQPYGTIPIISAKGQPITHESLLSVQPDFVYSSFASMFTPEQSGTREELQHLGVATYLTEFDCRYHDTVSGANFDMLFDEYRNLASILDIHSHAEELITEQQAIIDSGIATAQGIQGTPRVLWFYSTYAGTPWAAGPGGMPQHISDVVGVKNIFDDGATKWLEVNWDEVVNRNPDIIVLADLTRGEPGDTASEKIDALKSDPLTSQLDAVKNDRFIVIPGLYMDPGYGNAYAVQALAEGVISLQ